MTPLLKKYATIFQICITERLTYRTDFFLFTLMRFLPIITTIFLWQAVFAGSKETEIGGLGSKEIVAYYLLVTISRAFSSMPGLAEGIGFDIREGHIKKYLLQPVDMLGFLFVSRVAHKLVYYGIAAVPFALVFILCRDYFAGWPRPEVLAAYFLSLLLSFGIGFLFETLVGLSAFWLLEISSLNYILMMFVYVLSGHMFPLELFPSPIAAVMKWLPFQYLAYFPAKLFIEGGSIPAGEMWRNLGGQATWFLILLVAVRMTYSRGLKQYSAFGG